MSGFFCNFAIRKPPRPSKGELQNEPMAAKKRILFITQELAPYMVHSKPGQLTRELAGRLQQSGGEVRIFMPRYGAINERRNQLHEVIRLSGINIPIADADHPLIIKVSSLQPQRIQVYFIDNDDYFERSDDDADDMGSNRDNNDERLIFFTHGTVDTARKLRWDPDIIRCSGWMGALAPIYLRKVFNDEPSFKKSKIVYVVDDTAITAPLSPSFPDKLKAEGVREAEVKHMRNTEITPTMLQELAIKFSDAVIIQTPNPAPSIIEALQKGKKPWLPYEKASEEGGQALVDFYNSL